VSIDATSAGTDRGADRDDRPRLGISACLLGDRVRFDGGHKRDGYVTGVLARFCDWVPVCPEVEFGLGVPRESLRLEGAQDAPRLVADDSRCDLTDDMAAWSEQRVSGLRVAGLDGYLLKANSPSCGLFRVKVYPGPTEPASHGGRGMFAGVLADGLPGLPLEEESRLGDPVLRESFVERIFARRRWRDLLGLAPRARDLIAFHAEHKYQLLAHSPAGQSALGRLVAAVGDAGINRTVDAYGELFMQCLAAPATPGRHVNVLHHLARHLSRRLDTPARAEMNEVIESYRSGRVPLVVPLTLIGQHMRRLPQGDRARRQTYLRPYPRELMLRKAV